MTPDLVSKSVLVAAYVTVPVAVAGSVFFCTAATAPFKVSFDGGGELDCDKGIWIPMGKDASGRDKKFQTVLLRNIGAVPNTINFYAGSGGVQYYPPIQILSLLVQNAAVYPKGSGIKILAGGATDSYTGLDGAKVRKQFIVTNRSANLPILVLDPNNNEFLEVLAQRSLTFESGGVIKVKNPNVAAIEYIVGETFYA